MGVLRHKAWLSKGQEESPSNLRVGSFDWLVSVYKASPKYTKLPSETRSSYDRVLRLVSQYQLADRRALGFMPIVAFTPGVADALFEKLKINPRGGQRVRTAVLAMQVCRRAWTVARRAEPRRVPLDNPFGKMGLFHKATPTRLFQHDDLVRFVSAADAAGHRSVGTAAMIAFFLATASEGHFRSFDVVALSSLGCARFCSHLSPQNEGSDRHAVTRRSRQRSLAGIDRSVGRQRPARGINRHSGYAGPF